MHLVHRIAALLSIASAPIFAQVVHPFQTIADLSQTLAPQTPLRFAAASATSAPLTISVDDTARYQKMEGFGISMTEGSAYLLHEKLSPAVSREVMTRLFDPAHGIGLSFIRLPIGSTDLSISHYSYDDMPPGEQDPTLAHFSTAHDDAYVFPVMREALKLNPGITVMATPWSAPAWMKAATAGHGTAPTMNGGSLRPDAEPVFSQYLVRSLLSFEKQGITVKYLTLQNEPLHDTDDFPGTLMLADQQKRIIGQFLGPDLRRAGLKTEVLAYDHNWDHPEYPLTVLADPAANPFVAGSALHCYGGTPDAQTPIHDRYPDKGIWMTECSGGTWQHESPLLVTTHLLIDSTRNWAKAVSLWGVILDQDHNPHAGGCGTCRGLVTVDFKHDAAISYTGDFYALGHASQFVRPGAVRIGSSSPGRESLETVAFQNPDGTIALLVLNNRAETAGFDVRWGNSIFHGTLPAGALATYVWSGKR